MNREGKRRLTGALAVGVILVACAFIYFTQVRTAAFNTGLHQRIGEVMAEQTAGLIGKKGRIVSIAIPTREWPELKTELEAFRVSLKRLGDYELREYELDPKDQPKYGVGSGLSGRRYVRTVQKNEKADVFVSFVGVPKLDESQVKELTGAKKPRLVALSRSTDNLPEMFQAQLIDVAVVSRFQFPSPVPGKPDSPREWFDERFQIVIASNLKSVPPAE